jgi:acyl-CoA synthetase (AMP-forming)/AMP-acid ligase II
MDSRLPQCTLEQYETEFADRHLLHGVLAKWARKKPGDTALIHHNRKVTDTWATLENESTALAMQLLRLGFGKGDFLATSLPFLRELILLEYACFKIGVIHAQHYRSVNVIRRF